MSEPASISTPRFAMRPIARGDEAALFHTFADEAQCRYLSEPPFESDAALAAWLFEPGWPGLTWIAVDKASGAIAGRFVAVPRDQPDVFEIGYVVVMDRQGEGVARECTRALASHLFGQMGAARLTAEVDAENAASIRLLERLGFTRIAFCKSHERTHTGLRDVAFYALDRGDWQG